MGKKFIGVVFTIILVVVAISGCINESSTSTNETNSEPDTNYSNQTNYSEKFDNGEYITTINNIGEMNQSDVSRYLDRYFIDQGYQYGGIVYRDLGDYYSRVAILITTEESTGDVTKDFTPEECLIDKNTGEVRRVEF